VIGKLLLDCGANINAKNHSQKTALHIAAELSDPGMADLLLRNGAEVSEKDKRGQEALHTAVRIGRESIVIAFLDRGVFNVDSQDQQGQTPLHWACLIGQQAIVKRLLCSHCAVNAQDQYGQSALHMTAKRGYKVIASLLLEYGADVNAKDQHGRTALHYAKDEGHFALVEFLIGAGANTILQSNPTRTFFEPAIATLQTSLLYDLLADPSFREQILSNFLTPDQAHQNRENPRHNNVILVWFLLSNKERCNYVSTRNLPSTLIQKKLSIAIRVQQRLFEIQKLDSRIAGLPTADEIRTALYDIEKYKRSRQNIPTGQSACVRA
jgi:ankyrin repeat protein